MSIRKFINREYQWAILNKKSLTIPTFDKFYSKYHQTSVIKLRQAKLIKLAYKKINTKTFNLLILDLRYFKINI